MKTKYYYYPDTDRVKFKDVYKNDKLVETNNENPVSTINYICKMSKNLNIIDSELLPTDSANKNNNKNVKNISNIFRYPFCVKGVEDIRIIEYKNGTTISLSCAHPVVGVPNANAFAFKPYSASSHQRG